MTKEVKTMKYETPELNALTPAIDAIQTPGTLKTVITGFTDARSPANNDAHQAYVDWED